MDFMRKRGGEKKECGGRENFDVREIPNNFELPKAFATGS